MSEHGHKDGSIWPGPACAVCLPKPTSYNPGPLKPVDPSWKPVPPPTVTEGIQVMLKGHQDLGDDVKAFEFQAVIPGSVQVEFLAQDALKAALVYRIRMKINKTLMDEGAPPKPVEGETGLQCPNCGVPLGV